MSFTTTKFHEILLSCFRGVVLTRKTGLTDRQVKTIIPSTTSCVGYKKVAKRQKEKFISEHISKDNVYLTNYNS